MSDQASYRQIKNRIEGWLAGNRDNLQAMVKSTFTLLVRFGMDRAALAPMLDDIYAESVKPFVERPAGSAWSDPGRLDRFNRVKSLLLA
jgi:hypothetical protein